MSQLTHAPYENLATRVNTEINRQMRIQNKTRTQLAELLNVDPSQVTRRFNCGGGGRSFDFTELETIANWLDVDPQALTNPKTETTARP